MYACGLCRELISESSGAAGQNGASGVRPLLATKCGHLFHSDCLKNCFEKKSGGGVWSTKDCPFPNCKMSLTVATDLLRIFPTTFTVRGPSKQELTEKVQKYERDILELRNRLESSFLNLRDAENAKTGLLMEIEKLNGITKSQILYMKSECEARIQSVLHENEALKKTLQSIHHNIIQVGNGNGALSMAPPGFDPIESQRVLNGVGGSLQGGKALMLRSNRNNDLIDNISSVFENNLNLNKSRSEKQDMDNSTIDPAVDEFLNELHMERSTAASTNRLKAVGVTYSTGGQYLRSAKVLTNSKEPLYGRYYCDQCTATWGSAKNIIPQTCLKCGNVVYPHTQVPVIPKTSPAK